MTGGQGRLIVAGAGRLTLRRPPGVAGRGDSDMFVHGRCRNCGPNVVYRWLSGRPLLRNAACPRCGKRLKQTAIALMAAPEIRDEQPKFLARGLR